MYETLAYHLIQAVTSTPPVVQSNINLPRDLNSDLVYFILVI